MAPVTWDPVRVFLQSSVRDVLDKARIELVKMAAIAVAAGLLLSAGLTALVQVVGYPVAALVFAAVFSLLALVVHLLGHRRAIRRAHRAARARSRAESDIALATSVARSGLPVIPFVAFLAAFALARGR